MDAINKVKDKSRLRKASIWSLRWKKVDNEWVLGNAKPCHYCRSLMIKWGIKTVYYSDDNGIIQKENINQMKSKLTTGSVIHLRSNLGYKNISFQRPICYKCN